MNLDMPQESAGEIGRRHTVADIEDNAIFTSASHTETISVREYGVIIRTQVNNRAYPLGDKGSVSAGQEIALNNKKECVEKCRLTGAIRAH